MVDNQALRHAFNKYRAHGEVPASRALELARRNIWTQVWGGNVRYYTSSPWAAPYWRKNGFKREPGAAAFIESPESAGFRLVAFADEILERLGHTGWFTDIWQEGTFRGAVLQLPGRKGEARYVAAYQESDNDGFVIDLSRGAVFSESRRGDASSYDRPSNIQAARDAARAADSFAEHEAEEAQEYDRALLAGRIWAEKLEEEREARKQALTLAGEARALRRKVAPDEAPTVCEALRSKFRDLVDSITESRSARAKLASGDFSKGDFYLGFYPSEKLQATFCEGAGIEAFSA